MTDKVSPKDWIFRVTTKRLGSLAPTVHIYDVAIPDAADAVEAVRKFCGAGSGTIVKTVAELPSWTNHPRWRGAFAMTS